MPSLPLFTKCVPFADTDMAGVVHFSRILCYVEEAEHAAMLHMGVKPIDRNGGYPKVRVECDYTSPLRLGDSVEVQMSLSAVGSRSLTWSFVIRVDGTNCATGKMVTVYTSRKGGSVELGAEDRAALSAYL